EHVVDRFVLRVGYGKRFARTTEAPLIRMTQRRRLDLLLAEQAAASGADFRDGARVDGLEIDPNGITAVIHGSRVHASYVVGADGANGVVGRAAGLGDGIVNGVALEGNVPWESLEPHPYHETAWVELGVISGGYAWVFPKGDHANLGVGGWLREGPRLRGHLDRLAREHGVDPSTLCDVRGHRLPMRAGVGDPRGSEPRRSGRVASDRVLLVGDAAGLVDPLSGDGIYEAFVSARLAAEAVLVDRPGEYESALATALDRHAGASWKAKRVADRFPRACFWAVRAPGVFDAVAGLLRGELRHPSEARGLARPPLRALAGLARIARSAA
ncbi:MAG TPA: NAD(P)/FAD-dependent oxidoreductase, partial [Gaiellaceae bacterium]|nr:NAD(P)/FAD-dependent oxidoreductase [Gaiellaceae bacterium]